MYVKKTLFILFFALLALNFFSIETEAQTSSNFSCTMVIGYSQVGLTPLESPGPGYGEGWYVAPNNTRNFENLVDDDRWQLLWESGHGINQWQNPGALGWSRWASKQYPWFASPCATNSATPDRAILSVSGPYGTDLNLWRTNIKAAITTILQQVPSVQQLVLEPVVGGPNHQTCPCNPEPGSIMQCGCDTCDGINVRASQQHPFIDTAISQVLQEIQSGNYNPPGGVEVVAGFSPEVATCSGYYDGIGHLTTQGAQAVGISIAQYHLGQTTSPTPTPTAGGSPTPTPLPTLSPTPTPTPTPQCSPLPGDGNRDCNVNGIDYVIWLNNYGRNGPPESLSPVDGDYFDDDKINGIDYVVWLNNYTG